LRNVQDACYVATFLILLLFDHKGLVCKNTAVWIDERTGRVSAQRFDVIKHTYYFENAVILCLSN